MKTLQLTSAILSLLGVMIATQRTEATIINDMTGGSSVTINGGIFSTINFQTSGTGVLQPFIRIQDKGTQGGYNTSLGTPLDVDSSWNSDLLLSSLQSFTVNGISYYDFRLDLNQSGSDKGSQITLNQVQIFGGNTPAPATGVGIDGTTGRATSANLLGTLLWDMNPNGDTANALLLDYNLNSGGSGNGDMQMLIPTSVFSGQTYVVLYSQFGINPIADGTASNAGFEEWTALTGTTPFSNVPEPSTVVAGALMLVPLCVQAFRRFRKQ